MPFFTCFFTDKGMPSSPRPIAEATGGVPVIIYGMPASTCTQRVVMTCEEKGIPYEIKVVDLTKGEQKAPEFLAKQPFGKIPVLEDGPLQMFESRAMARHLARSRAGQGTELLGADAHQQALTETWMEAEAQNFNGPISTLVYEYVFKAWFGQGGPDQAVVDKQLADLEKVLDVYESILATRPYIAGNTFSLADISHMPYTQYLINAGVTAPFYSRPHVKAWWERISSRPSWKKATGGK